MIRKIIFSLFFIVSLWGRECYSILTETGLFTPVYPYNFRNNPNFRDSKCPYLDPRIIWDSNLSYVGCYRRFNDAAYALHTMNFNFKNPKIVKHKLSFKDQYVIFPNPSKQKIKNVNAIISRYSPRNILNKFPTKFYGNGIDFLNIEKTVFMPTINLYEFYRYYKKHGLDRKVMILYNGVYSFEGLYKKINNPDIIEKVSNSTYILKVPIYISPTASLVIKNKKILLETTPKPIFIMYHGKLYAKNSKFIAWNLKTNSYDVREYIPESELLLIGKQKPRPYFLGMAGSRGYFVNNLFEGLGFHSTSAFGIAMSHFPGDFTINSFGIYMFLSQKEDPVGYYVGNTMRKNMMGFYCSNAKNSAIIGNLMYDNIIYNIDPHDYSNGLVIARNVTSKAIHAHGIVISRQVDYAIIAQNLSFNNHSAGIMLDRLSNHNLVYDNLSIYNGYMGISIQESDDVLIEKNILIGNKIDGIIIRNSLKNTIKNNLIMSNFKSGVEVITKSIDNLIYRDFARDPYHKATAAVIENNKIVHNGKYGINVKNNAAVYIKGNEVNSNLTDFGGDLNVFLAKIRKNNGKFKLYGIGNPYRRISSDLIKVSDSVIREVVDIFNKEFCKNNKVTTILARIYNSFYKDPELTIQELQMGILKMNVGDMYAYGFLKLSEAKTKEDYINALSYIAQSIIFGKENAKIDIIELPYVLSLKTENLNNYLTKEDINKAFEMAINRLKNFKLLDEKVVSCDIDSQTKAKIESKLKLFEYIYKTSNSKDYYDFCYQRFKKFNIFTKDVLKKIQHIYAKANWPKLRYQRQQRKVRRLIANNKACKEFSIIQAQKEKEFSRYFQTQKKQAIPKIKTYVRKYLNLINRYRLSPISESLIYKLLQETP